MRPSRFPVVVLSCALAVLAGCGGGSKKNSANRGSFLLSQISTGQGQVFPYRIRQLDSLGNPTTTILNIESIDTLHQYATSANGVLPPATLPDTTTLPDGSPGNNFLQFRFTHELKPESILSGDQAAIQTNSGLTSAISVLAYDPVTEASVMAKGRGFVGGYTYVRENNQLVLKQVVTVDGSGNVMVDPSYPELDGFPRGFTGDEDLVAPNSFVFVADSDQDLRTLETFDPGNNNLVLRLIVNNSVRDTDERVLAQEACTATTVGSDPNPANVLGFSGSRVPEISPGNGQTGVSPLTDVYVTFNKPVQPVDVGTFFTTSNLTPAAGGIALNVTINEATFSILYYADPVAYGDLCTYRIRPAYSLPGKSTVTFSVTRDSVHAVKDNMPLGVDVATTFATGRGPGIINAPVSPDAIYIGIGGSDPGISVIDLNGYGQGTNGLEPDAQGNPTLDPTQTFFALNNPNIGQPGLVPSLGPGSSQLDAGSNGPLTLVEDTSGNTNLVGSPILNNVADIHVGCPLDLVYNNENINVNAGPQNQINLSSGVVQPGNCIAISTHPNPPRLRFPPPNPSKAIFAEEPTYTGGPIPKANLLVPGNRPDFRQRNFPGVFYGPAPAPSSPPPPPQFIPYESRQQIGHFLYVLDHENRQILVLNSNRFTVLDAIAVTDPQSMTMSPSLGLIAVSNFSSSTVSFIDIDPRNPTFNTIVATTETAAGPSQLAWQPDGETIVVACKLANAVTIVSASDFSVLKIVSGNVVDPIGIAVTERYINTGNASGIYYAYILNSNGTVAVFESGPDGTNGIGFNDIIGTVQPVFRRPTGIRMDYTSGLGGFYVSHLDDSNVAAVSRCELTSSPQGQLPIQQQTGTGFQLPPTFRQKEWTVTERYGGSDPTLSLNLRLSGNSVSDFVFDEMNNVGVFPNQRTPNNGSLGTSVIGHSAKGTVLINPQGGPVRPYTPAYLFVAMGDTGKIDIIDVVARVKVKTIDVPGVTILSSYWRQ